jgi:hypothetical protein
MPIGSSSHVEAKLGQCEEALRRSSRRAPQGLMAEAALINRACGRGNGAQGPRKGA